MKPKLLITIFLVFDLALAGYLIYSLHNRHTHISITSVNTTSDQSTFTNHLSAPAINQSSDIKSVITALDQVNPTADNISDISQLSSQTSF